MLYEISRRSVGIPKHTEAKILWNYDILTVLTEKGVSLLQVSHNLQCYDKKIDVLEYYLEPSISSPTGGIFTNKFLRTLSNQQLTQMVLEPALWPHNNELLIEMVRAVDFHWSPIPILFNNIYTLAVLNNVGNIDFYRPSRNDWISMLDTADKLKAYYKHKISSVSGFDEMKKLAYSLQTTAFCWGIQSDKCYIVTVQNSGDVLLWNISKGDEINAEIIGCVHSQIPYVTRVLWLSKPDGEFALICVNLEGLIVALDCKIENNDFILTNTNMLWPQKDRMVSKRIYCLIIDDKLIIIANKHRHLLVQMFNMSYAILFQYFHNINDYKITDIYKGSDEFYVTTAIHSIHKVMLQVSNNEVEIKLSEVPTKDLHIHNEYQGISFTESKVICALAFYDRKVSHRKEPLHLYISFMSESLNHENELDLLINNPIQNLYNFWDCIELIRLKAMKTKELPYYNYEQLWKDSDTDLYKLKIFLIITIINQFIGKYNIVDVSYTIPNISIQEIRDKIILFHAKSIINDLNVLYKINNSFSALELESYNGCKNFLKYYTKKYKKTLLDVIETPKLNLSTVEVKYVCQGCDELLNNFKCKNGHLNMYCSISLTLIDCDDYLVCSHCNSIARREVYGPNVACIFCDCYLNFCYEPKNKVFG